MESELPPPDLPPASGHWLVDGFNVLHACFFGESERREWWTEEHRQRLVARVRRFAGTGQVWVVFDGSRPQDPGPEEDRVRVVFAPSADAWMVRWVREAPESGDVAVVTSDRKVADRCRSHGARVVTPSDFLRQCPDPPASD